MGAKFWKFNGDSCKIEMVGVTADPPKGSETGISCDCNSTVCHVVTLYGSLFLYLFTRKKENKIKEERVLCLISIYLG